PRVRCARRPPAAGRAPDLAAARRVRRRRRRRANRARGGRAHRRRRRRSRLHPRRRRARGPRRMTRARSVALALPAVALALAGCPGHRAPPTKLGGEPASIESDIEKRQRLLAELQDDILASYERDEPPDYESQL